MLAPTYEEIKKSEVALLAPTYEEIKKSEVALLAPTYVYGYVGVVDCFVFHSGSIITRGWVGWKGKVGVGTICFMYVSDYWFIFQFLVVRIAGLSESLKAQRTLKTLKEEGNV